MKKRILEYMSQIDNLIKEYDNTSDTDTNSDNSSKKAIKLTQAISEHLIQLSFFQHERLIHLIVTCLFAILTVASIFFTIATSNLTTLILTALFLILLIPYIKHYYLLENGVQYMYTQYDKLLELKKTLS